MNNDILKLYHLIGTNQDSSTSLNSSKIVDKIIIDSKQIAETKSNNELIKQNHQGYNDGKIILKKQITQYPVVASYDDQEYCLQNQRNSSVIQHNENISNSYLKRKREKCSKGLRHFSMKVCEKVKQKSITTYNEVADELVQEYCNYSGENGLLDYWSYDQKNVRRRVYDALNVLMAMNIISKEKKEIKWIGLPCNKKQECQELEEEKKRIIEAIKIKYDKLNSLIIEQISLKMLVERNKINENINNNTIKLPFMIISTDKKTTIDCNIASDKKEFIFHFDNTFKINTHLDILKKLNLSIELGTDLKQSEQSEEKYKSMIPKMFHFYLQTLNPEKLICDLPYLPNYKKLIKYDKTEKHNKSTIENSKDLFDRHNESLDEAIDYSGDSDATESDDNSLGDFSN